MNERLDRAIVVLTRFNDSGPLARMVSGALLTLTSVFVILGAVALAQFTRPVVPAALPGLVQGQSSLRGG